MPLSDAVTVEGIAAPMELTTTSHRAPTKFTMWAGAGELWFWGKHCTGQGTTQFVLDGTASAVARPAFQAVRAHPQLPPLADPSYLYGWMPVLVDTCTLYT